MKPTRICKTCGVSGTTYYESRPMFCGSCYRLYQRQRSKTPHALERIKNYSKARYQKHRDKYLARAAVKQAVNTGMLLKPDACQRCGEVSPTQAHHDDYAKPLEVRWLCDICHKYIDGRLVDMNLLSREAANE